MIPTFRSNLLPFKVRDGTVGSTETYVTFKFTYQVLDFFPLSVICSFFPLHLISIRTPTEQQKLQSRSLVRLGPRPDDRRIMADSHIPCRSPAVLKTDSHIPCRSPAATLPFSDSAVSFVKVLYLVHEVLLSSSSNYLLLNCYHIHCAVNYTSTRVPAPK
jgi:hypothetical protein